MSPRTAQLNQWLRESLAFRGGQQDHEPAISAKGRAGVRFTVPTNKTVLVEELLEKDKDKEKKEKPPFAQVVPQSPARTKPSSSAPRRDREGTNLDNHTWMAGTLNSTLTRHAQQQQRIKLQQMHKQKQQLRSSNQEASSTQVSLPDDEELAGEDHDLMFAVDSAANPLCLYQVDPLSLERIGLDRKTQTELYRSLFVFSTGVSSMIRDVNAKASEDISLRIWKVLVRLLEANNPKYQDMILQILNERDKEIGDMMSFQDRLIAQANQTTASLREELMQYKLQESNLSHQVEVLKAAQEAHRQSLVSNVMDLEKELKKEREERVAAVNIYETVRGKLNAMNAELEGATRERDDYASRLKNVIQTSNTGQRDKLQLEEKVKVLTDQLKAKENEWMKSKKQNESIAEELTKMSHQYNAIMSSMQETDERVATMGVEKMLRDKQMGNLQADLASEISSGKENKLAVSMFHVWLTSMCEVALSPKQKYILSIVLDQLGAAKTDEMFIKRINQMMPSMQERVQELVALEEELFGLRVTQQNFQWQAHVNTVMSRIWTQSAASGHEKAIELKRRLGEVEKELKGTKGQVSDLERERDELMKLRITIEKLEAENLTLLNFKTLYSNGQADLERAKTEIANLSSKCHDLRSLLASEEELSMSKKKHIRELTEELKATKVKFDHVNDAHVDRSLLLSSMRNLMFAVQGAFTKLVEKIEGAGDAGDADGKSDDKLSTPQEKVFDLKKLHALVESIPTSYEREKNLVSSVISSAVGVETRLQDALAWRIEYQRKNAEKEEVAKELEAYKNFVLRERQASTKRLAALDHEKEKEDLLIQTVKTLKMSAIEDAANHKATLTALTKRVESQAETITLLEEKVQAQAHTIDECERKYESFADETKIDIEDLESKVSFLREELEEIKEEKRRLLDDLAEKKSRHDSVQQELSQALTKLSALGIVGVDSTLSNIAQKSMLSNNASSQKLPSSILEKDKDIIPTVLAQQHVLVEKNKDNAIDDTYQSKESEIRPGSSSGSKVASTKKTNKGKSK